VGSRIRRRAVAAVIGVIALASLPGIPVEAASAAKVAPFAAGGYRQLPAAQLVNARQLHAPVAGSPSSFVRPKLVKNHNALTALPSSRTATPSQPTPRRGGNPGAARPLTGTTQGTVLEQLTSFPGMDITTDVTLFGQDNNLEPPDTQIAVGPDTVVEMVNANMSVWSKYGKRTYYIDLNTFYGVPAGYLITDPRVLYDKSSGRFIASAVAITNSWNSNVYLAVSQSSDPTGTWTRQGLKTTSAVLLDQPKVGTSDDKITLAWSEWVNPPCDQQATFACFTGEEFSVVDKADMLAGGPAVEYLSGPDLNHYAVVPVQALSSTTTQYMAYNNADPYYLVENQCAQPNPPNQYGTCPTIGILSITGSVHANTLMLREDDRPINATTAPPQAVQQNSAGVIDTGDDRLLTAVWQNNQLWTTLGDGNFCPNANPNGPGLRSCVKVIEVLTDNVPMFVQKETTLDSGDFTYHPALSLDSVGDLFMVFSRSSATMYPSVWVTGLPASTPNIWSLSAALQAGTGPYDSKTLCGGNNRWGDYSGASIDGGDPTDIWLAGEYAVFDTRNCTWKTVIGQFTYSAPTVTSITPKTGPGGTSVTITGTNFFTGNTTPYFAATPSQSGTTTVLTPNSLTTTAPPGNGWVTISAATLDGHGPAGPTYKYPRVEDSPVPFAALAGAVARAGAPPAVPTKTSRPRPAIPARLFRLLRL
jgi:hypothetical protein